MRTLKKTPDVVRGDAAPHGTAPRRIAFTPETLPYALHCVRRSGGAVRCE